MDQVFDKSEVIWVGYRRTVSTHGCPAIRIGNDTICATNKARLLGVLLSTDLTFNQHVTSVSGQCFYQLRQLRSVSRYRHRIYYNTDPCFRLEPRGLYCCSLLIGSPRSVTNKLQRVLSAAARVITNTKKYESGLSRISDVVLETKVLVSRRLEDKNTSLGLGLDK